MTNTHDPVNHPKHYTSHPSGVECIDVTRHMSFNLGNVVKYLWRSGLKDGAPTIQDLEKAAWYLNDEIGKMKKAATGMRYANDVKSNIDEVADQINAAVNPPIEVKTTEHPIEEVSPSARLPKEELDRIEGELKKYSVPVEMINGKPYYRGAEVIHETSLLEEWDSNRRWQPNDLVQWGEFVYRMNSDIPEATFPPHESYYWTKIES